jgi:hypothetical protein
MNENCVRCEGGIRPNNTLIKCDIEDCNVHVHSSCIRYNEGVPVEGGIIWLCSIHHNTTNNPTSIQLDQHNRGQCSQLQNGQENRPHNVTVDNLLELEDNDQIRVTNGENQAQPLDSLANENQPSCSQIRNNNGDSSSVQELDCLRCNEYQESDFISCLGCIRHYHVACLSAMETNRIVDFNFTCEDCFLIQSRLSNVTNRLGNVNVSSEANNNARRTDRNPRRQTRFNTFTTRMEYDPQSHGHNSNRQNFVSSSPRRTNNVRNSTLPRLSQYSSIENSHARHSAPNCTTRTSQAHSINDSMMLMMEKSSLRELPEVTDSHLSWCTFYETYCNTKSIFMDYENVVRIKKAIKDAEVLQIGGNNLFNVRTYDETLHKINVRLGRNLAFLNTEANALQALSRLKAENYKKIIEFIDRVVNFNNLATAYNESSYTSNKIFINSLSLKLPIYLHNKWVTKQCLIESQQVGLRLQHFVDVLEEELPIASTRYRNSLLPSYDETKGTSKDHRVHNIDVEKSDVRKVRFDSKTCWYHKSNQHPSHKCKLLWKMDGDKVIELAKENNRCIICGQEDHVQCPFREKLKCQVRDCTKKHHSLYCDKRKANWRPKDEMDKKEVSYDTDEIEEISNELNHTVLDINEDNCHNTREGRKFITNLSQPVMVSSHRVNTHVVSENKPLDVIKESKQKTKKKTKNKRKSKKQNFLEINFIVNLLIRIFNYLATNTLSTLDLMLSFLFSSYHILHSFLMTKQTKMFERYKIKQPKKLCKTKLSKSDDRRYSQQQILLDIRELLDEVKSSKQEAILSLIKSLSSKEAVREFISTHDTTMKRKVRIKDENYYRSHQQHSD